MGRLTPPARSLLPPSWRVDLPLFEGPLDLLLHLVRINEVEIVDIPVARVCDQFHEYLALMEELNLDVAGDFIYEAALLIHLKSRMLLPRPERPGEQAQEDPREELVQRLLEYRRIKEAAQSLAEVESLRRGLWTRAAPPPELGAEESEEIDLGDVSLFDLLGALRTALARFEKEHPPPFHLARETFSVRDQVHRLLTVLDAGRPYDFVDDLKRRTCRAEAVSAFLALLELARLHLVRIHQTGVGDLLLYRTTREARIEELEALAP
ncbi:MAG TPA: segregation/condensation protein A [Thermoanaerobaculia bacterium]|nr:segregation/condensation protein A [Thermoanaerobaculia bacterium]